MRRGAICESYVTAIDVVFALAPALALDLHKGMTMAIIIVRRMTEDENEDDGYVCVCVCVRARARLRHFFPRVRTFMIATEYVCIYNYVIV
jgi:hypothetical protein